MAKKTTAVTTSPKKSTAVATSSDGDMFAKHARAGMENVKASDILIPRISILQQLSPQLKKQNAAFIKGAEEGMICDVSTGTLLPSPMMFLPVHYAKVYLEWFPRSTGKGLAAIHESDEVLDQCTYDDKRKPFLPNGNYIAETAQFFGLNLSMDGIASFIPMGSTQLKKARKWLTLATGERLKDSNGEEFTPPLFYRTYMLSSAPESNVEGDWHGWVIERGPALTELEGWRRYYDAAMLMREQVTEGKAKADLRDMDEGGARPSASADGDM